MRKAAGFKKPGDARRYILRHGMVRAVLGHYLHGDPEKIRFVQGMNGKPDLDPEAIFPDIRFSLSGTDERVCLGITRNSEIGLDIVRTQPRYSCPAVAHYLFTQTERRWIAQAVPDRRPMRFFRVWSLKEALLKASGNSARLMQDVDVAGIMTDTYLNGGYPLHIGKKEMLFFIHESGCGTGHHRVIATLL
jgi:4'-phosphopantetheinyl transferase